MLWAKHITHACNPSHTSFRLVFLSPAFADSIPMAALLLTRLSHPVDVRGRWREAECPFVLLFAPPGAPPVSARPACLCTNSAADSDTTSCLLRAATTSAALSIVCTGTKATEDSVGTAVAPPGSGARWGYRRAPLLDAVRSLFLLRPPFGLGSVWPSPRPSPSGERGPCVVGD